jgi:putative glutathione S-transferase
MGVLVDGVWDSQGVLAEVRGGAFIRPESRFRSWVTPDGDAGPTGEAGFKAEAGRYHLYISRACPWAHRTTILRALKGLEPLVGLSVVHWRMADEGWTFEPGPGVIPDPLNHVRAVHELFSLADPSYTGRVTVPILWDSQRRTMVSNESADIVRMFNSAFDALTGNDEDFYPPSLRKPIDAVNALVYAALNNGVYRAGFATSQGAYDEAVQQAFDALDQLEAMLEISDFLCGDQITEADWRLFPTLVRFDPVYVPHFRCNLRRLSDYPRLTAYAHRLLAVPGVVETIDLDHIRKHYFLSHTQLNPSGIIPIGFPSLLDQSGQGRLPGATGC